MNERMTDHTATENNLAFLELYKSVDRFIRDAYSSGEGVSEYIRIMEAKGPSGQRYAAGWADDYRMLKRVRWIRNRLAHEVGYDSDITEENDYEWLRSFEQRLYDASDPLALVFKQECYEARCREEEQRRRLANDRKEAAAKPAAEKRQTLWQRIKAFFRGE